MKLNKVLALALSGVMAVSMLAGCSGNPGNGGQEGEGETTVDTTVASVLNDEQAATDNKVKIDFTYSSSLENALEKALTEFGASVKPENVDDRIAEILGVKDVNIEELYGSSAKDHDNKEGKQTSVVVIKKSGLTDTGVAKEMYTTMKDKLAKLTPDWEPENSEIKWSFDYTGETAMVKVATETQTYTYMVATITCNTTKALAD